MGRQITDYSNPDSLLRDADCDRRPAVGLRTARIVVTSALTQDPGSQILDHFATENLLGLVDVGATVSLRPRVAACAGPIAVESALAILATSLVFAERNVLVLGLATYIKAMMIKESVRKSLEATFGRAGSLFGHALLASV